MSMDAEELIAAAQLPQVTTTLCIRADLVGKWEKLHAEWRTAPEVAESLAEPSRKAQLAAQLRDLHEEMEKHQVTFVFQALPADEYSALIAAHPPVGEDRAKYRWNEATFRPALVAKCLIEPEMTEEQVGRLMAKLSAGQQKELRSASYLANEEALDIPFDGGVYAESLNSGSV